MSRKARVLKHGICEVTQGYKGAKHQGIDIVKEGYQLDYIVAHSDGTVVEYRNSYTTTDTTGNSYGNYVKIKHEGNYYTLYAHLQYRSVPVKTGDKVTKGQIIGYMGNTGHSFGGHLHFEVWKGGTRIDPTPYLEKDLPSSAPSTDDKVNVYYRVKTEKHGWLGEIKNYNNTDSNGYAGWENSPITGLAVRVDKGSIKYRVHIKGGNWLGWITKYDINDYHYGYAGDNKPIDAIQIYYYTPDNIRPYKRAKYKVNNYDWQYDTEISGSQDGYAGLMGVNATKVQISIE